MTFAIAGSARLRKRQKPAPTMWECRCNLSVDRENVNFDYARINPGYLVRCPDCGTRRP